jgi:hypothetical protein
MPIVTGDLSCRRLGVDGIVYGSSAFVLLETPACFPQKSQAPNFSLQATTVQTAEARDATVNTDAISLNLCLGARRLGHPRPPQHPPRVLTHPPRPKVASTLGELLASGGTAAPRVGGVEVVQTRLPQKCPTTANPPWSSRAIDRCR